jgi:hypothetical protein
VPRAGCPARGTVTSGPVAVVDLALQLAGGASQGTGVAERGMRVEPGKAGDAGADASLVNFRGPDGAFS